MGIFRPLVASHILRVPSQLALTMSLASGLKATLAIKSVCPMRGTDFPAVACIPDLYSLVGAAAGDAFTVRAEGQALDPSLVPERTGVRILDTESLLAAAQI